MGFEVKLLASARQLRTRIFPRFFGLGACFVRSQRL